MDHYMPEIFWHDRQALLSVDVFPRLVNDKYRIATSSVQKEIRLWYLHFEQVSMPVLPLAVDFVANLAFHNSAVNQIKFSPTSDVALLASADCDGRVVIWQLNSDSAPPPATEDLPPNKENWVRLKVLNHDSDVSSICWSPDGKYLASVSNDDCLLVHEALTGKRSVSVRNFRHFPNGVSWDPLSKYLVTMSADRKMDLIDAAKGTKLRCFGHTTLPSARVIQPEAQLEEKQYRLFHDDQLFSFQRGVSFSPCGQFIAAPCAHIESGPADIYGTFIFKREHLNKETPFALLPSPKPTFLVRFCPLVMELLDGDANLLGLPYRVLFLALTKDSILFYDSQHAHPIGSVENIHYNALTDAAWSTDGRIVVVSSLEGYCSFLRLNLDKWGQQYTGSLEAVAPLSPQLIQTKKKKTKKEKAVTDENALVASDPSPQVTASKSQSKPNALQPSTPKNRPSASASIEKFFKRGHTPKENRSDSSDKKEEDGENAQSESKRIQLEPAKDQKPSQNDTTGQQQQQQPQTGAKRRIQIVTLT